ncbi:MAG: TetR/AcrR family transcriptional regulator [Bdellovibrionota bacterium]
MRSTTRRKTAPARALGRPPGISSARGKILQGATVAFGKKGYAATAVEDILEAAGVSRRTFYRFFSNKDEVFQAIYEVATTMLFQGLRSVSESKDEPLRKLERVAETFLRLQVGAGPIARVLNAEAQRPGSVISGQRQALLKQLVSLFQDEIEKAGRGRVDPLLIRGLAAALEQISLGILSETERTETDIQRGLHAILRIMEGTLVDSKEAAKIRPLPLDPARKE